MRFVLMAALLTAAACAPATECEADCEDVNDACEQSTDCEVCERRGRQVSCTKCFSCLSRRDGCAGIDVDPSCTEMCDMCLEQ